MLFWWFRPNVPLVVFRCLSGVMSVPHRRENLPSIIPEKIDYRLHLIFTYDFYSKKLPILKFFLRFNRHDPPNYCDALAYEKIQNGKFPTLVIQNSSQRPADFSRKVYGSVSRRYLAPQGLKLVYPIVISFYNSYEYKIYIKFLSVSIGILIWDDGSFFLGWWG